MSTRVRLAGKLPGDVPVNGIDPLAEELCDRWFHGDPNNPASVLVIGVVKVRSFQLLRDQDGMLRVPTVEISRLEPLGVLGQDATPHLSVASLEDQQRLLDAAEERTGVSALPIDAETSLDNHTVLGED